MTVDEVLERASRCILMDAVDHLPSMGMRAGIAGKGEIVHLLDWRFRDGILIGDHHADREHPHSVRITVRRNVDGLLLICTTDGEIDLKLTLSDRPGDWITDDDLMRDPSSSVVTLLKTTVILLAPSPSRPTLDHAHDWTTGVATICAMAADMEMTREMTMTMATPFGDAEIQSSFFAGLPSRNRRRAYDVLESLKTHAPCGVSVVFDPSRPERVGIGRMAMSKGVPEGVVERMRAIRKLRAMIPDDVVLPL